MQKSAVMPTRAMISFQLAAKNSRFPVTIYLCEHHPLTLAVHWIFSGKNEIQIPSAMYLMEKTGDMAYNQVKNVNRNVQKQEHSLQKPRSDLWFLFPVLFRDLELYTRCNAQSMHRGSFTVVSSLLQFERL
jgi:hypothetical protein